MRRGFQGLSAQVQTVLQQQPFTAAFHTASGAASKSKGCEWPNTKLMRGKAASGAHAG
jgi:hypothetical protein